MGAEYLPPPTGIRSLGCPARSGSKWVHGDNSIYRVTIKEIDTFNVVPEEIINDFAKILTWFCSTYF
jgi:hypothetical protein